MLYIEASSRLTTNKPAYRLPIVRFMPTRSTSHQINFPPGQLPPDQFPTRSTSHQINFPPGQLPPDQLPTRSTSHQINFPPDQLPMRSTSHQIRSESMWCTKEMSHFKETTTSKKRPLQRKHCFKHYSVVTSLLIKVQIVNN